MRQTTINCLNKTYTQMASDLSGSWTDSDVSGIEFNRHDLYPLKVECVDGSVTAGKKDTFEYEWSDLQAAWPTLPAIEGVDFGQDGSSITFYWS